MGYRCSERKEAIVRGVAAAVRGDVKCAAQSAAFVSQSCARYPFGCTAHGGDKSGKAAAGATLMISYGDVLRKDQVPVIVKIGCCRSSRGYRCSAWSCRAVCSWRLC
jgi:hypothetical protein